jgi:hypothetical protein
MQAESFKIMMFRSITVVTGAKRDSSSSIFISCKYHLFFHKNSDYVDKHLVLAWGVDTHILCTIGTDPHLLYRTLDLENLDQ